MKLPSILWRDFSEDHSMLLDCPTMIYIYNAIFYKNDQFPFFFTRSLQHIFTKKNASEAYSLLMTSDNRRLLSVCNL